MKYSKFLSPRYWISKLFPTEHVGIIPKKEIYRYLPDSPIIVEAGAHIGTDTLDMAKLWQDATIHAFEPVPHLFEILSKNTEGVKNIHTYPLALGETTGLISIHISSGKSDGSSSVLKPKRHLEIHPDVFFENTIKVEAITLDDWAKNHNIKQIDMLWLDLQGFELNVLKKSQSILRGITAIYTEVNLVETYENAASYDALKEWLSIFGFSVVSEALPWSDAGNVLFVNMNKVDKK